MAVVLLVTKLPGYGTSQLIAADPDSLQLSSGETEPKAKRHLIEFILREGGGGRKASQTFTGKKWQ